jgi:hypothetical protein
LSLGGSILTIKNVHLSDIPIWISLSREYDNYVLEIAPDLIEWYDGNDVSLSYDDYMHTKIKQSEAFMAINENDNCCGIIAFSKTNNRITFFAISHECDFYQVGKYLLEYALSILNAKIAIRTNIIKSNSEHLQKQRILFDNYGFAFLCDGIENGVPVCCFEKGV